MCIVARKGQLSHVEAEAAEDLITRLKGVSWAAILKALPFDFGPSSTRWVFLGTFLLIGLGMFLADLIIAWLLFRHQHVDGGVLTYSLAVKTALIGFASKNQSDLHKAQATTAGDAPQ